MVKTGPGKSKREIRLAIRSILRDREQNFNALFRQLKERKILGSPNILSEHLKAMQQDGEVLPFTQPGPGIPRKIYYLADRVPAKYGIELASRTGRSDLEEFWTMNPELAPVCITLGGAIHIDGIEPGRVQSLPALYDHTGMISSMFAVIRWYREITGQDPPKQSIETWVKAYHDLWRIAVQAQAEEFKRAMSEGRRPDYLTAVIKELEQRHRIELPKGADPWEWVVQRLSLPDSPETVELKKLVRKVSQQFERWQSLESAQGASISPPQPRKSGKLRGTARTDE